MGFWGIEVKPGKPHPYHSDNVEGTLYVTQATLGLGSSSEKSILQCSVGHKNPIFLCSLLPERIESCSLNLEFKDELVAFSVIGPRSIHLSGYFLSDEGDHLRDEYQSDSGEDIAETETEDSSEFDYDDDDDDENDFIDDDDIEMFAPSSVPNSGVVIEEIVDDDKPTNGTSKPKRSKKKNDKSSDHEDQKDSQRQIVTRGATDASVFESEDEDGFPVPASQKSEDVQEPQAETDIQKDKRAKEIKKKAEDGNDDATGKKRKVKSTEQDDQPIRKKEKLKQRSKEAKTDEIDDNEKNDISKDGIHLDEVKQQDSSDENELDQRVISTDAYSVHGEDISDKKKRKKKKKNKKKNQESGEDKNKDKTVSAVGDEVKSSLESQDNQLSGKSSQIRTFANGLVIEELAMGKPDGKRASPGCQVSVHYIGKLKKNGKIFDSNVGRAPFKFRLGVGQVIKGWDVGVNGMRIGDKRRLTIPPSMGYGERGASGKIPPNSWLVFDVELVNVR